MPTAVAKLFEDKFAKDGGGGNPNHDELGRFASGGGWQAKKKNADVAAGRVAAAGHESSVYSNPKSGVVAIYSNTDGKIHINSSHKFWSDPEGNMKKMGPEGTKYFSSSDPAHVINHEMGHAAYNNTPDNWMTLSHQDAAEEVSRYARMNPKEFVAETVAGRKAGRVFSPKVDQMFNQYARPSS